MPRARRSPRTGRAPAAGKAPAARLARRRLQRQPHRRKLPDSPRLAHYSRHSHHAHYPSRGDFAISLRVADCPIPNFSPLLRCLTRRSQREKTTFDHDTIRKWADAHDGKPAAVGSIHKDGDVGIIRIMFPDTSQSDHEDLVEISWDAFFKQFEESKLALIYEDEGRFSKIVSRDGID